jgi:hypothetical protein
MNGRVQSREEEKGRGKIRRGRVSKNGRENGEEKAWMAKERYRVRRDSMSERGKRGEEERAWMEGKIGGKREHERNRLERGSNRS